MTFYNQNNNKLNKNTCGISSYLNAMTYLGYPDSVFDFRRYGQGQLEDDIVKFFWNDNTLVSACNAFKRQNPNVIDNGWEVHSLLYQGIKKYFSPVIVNPSCFEYFESSKDIEQIVEWLHQGNAAVVSSEVFMKSNDLKLGHLICLVYKDGQVQAIDSFGDASNGYVTRLVGQYSVNYQFMRAQLKPLPSKYKIVHFIKKWGR